MRPTTATPRGASSGPETAVATNATRGALDGVSAHKPWAVYLLHCAGGKSYIGISPTPRERFEAHRAGKGAAFTRANLPQSLAAIVWFENRGAAASIEARLKALPRTAKLAWFERFNGPPTSSPATLAAGLASLQPCLRIADIAAGRSDNSSISAAGRKVSVTMVEQTRPDRTTTPRPR